jgi:aspartate-semialdehyde dehydrogenase
MKTYNIAIVGAGGLVGRKMLEVLKERNFPVNNLKLLASKRSAGTLLEYNGNKIAIEELNSDSFAQVDIALFSAGSYVSINFAPSAVKAGCVVIDNGSYYRMNPDVPLVIPEVNPQAIKQHKGIIANPNCSTIQMLTAINPIYNKYGINRIICSTYQSISGAGQSGIDKLSREIEGNQTEDKHRIAYNIMFHSAVENSDFTNEEEKMINETRKILNDDSIKTAVTCVRLPILGGHCESINLELNSEFELSEIRDLLANSPGIKIIDNIHLEEYATPTIVNNTDEVYISRLRRDETIKNGLYMFVCADNLRKGAATNAVQIAEELLNII